VCGFVSLFIVRPTSWD